MTDVGQEPEPPGDLPTDVAEALSSLSKPELRAAIDFAQKRRRHLQPEVTDQIEPAPGEEIVRIEEQTSYTLVSKRQPCAGGCAECPHGPYLYHVRRVSRPEGDSKLQWSYIGPDES